MPREAANLRRDDFDILDTSSVESPTGSGSVVDATATGTGAATGAAGAGGATTGAGAATGAGVGATTGVGAAGATWRGFSGRVERW